MNKMKLLGAASLAAMLMAAAPALAATPESTANPQPAPAATAPAATPAPATNTSTAMNQNAANMNAAETSTHGPYGRAGIGMGGYTADQYYITKNNNGHPVNNNNNNNADLRPSQRNPILADNGSIRASKMIGTDVYNANDQKLGSVDDVLIGTNGLYAVVSTNQKKVAVPFDHFKVGDAKNEGDDKLVLPNETQAKLNTQYEIHYDASNYQDWQAAHNNNNNNNQNLNNRNAENANGPTTGVLGPRHPNNKNPG